MKTKRQRSLERECFLHHWPASQTVPQITKFPEAETPAVPSKPKKNAMLRNDW